MNRSLPVINAAGCVVLVGFIFIQWFGGQKLDRELHAARTAEIVEKNARIETEKEVKRLQSDIQGLKDSVDSIRQSAEAAEAEVKLRDEELQKFATGLEEAQGKMVEWETAVKERDEAIAKRDEALLARDAKLKEMNDSLVATRRRLDQAVAELKKAGAR